MSVSRKPVRVKVSNGGELTFFREIVSACFIWCGLSAGGSAANHAIARMRLRLGLCPDLRRFSGKKTVATCSRKLNGDSK